MQLRQTLIRFLQAGGGAVRWRALAAVCALAALAVPVRAQSNAFSFSSGVYVVAENTPGFATITVLYGGGATNAVSVDYATGGGTATNNVHYTGLTNTLVFAVGDTSNIFTIPIFDDAVSNGARTVGLTLANPQGGAILGAPVAATLLITDDESPTNLPPANNQFTNAAILTGLFGTFANTNTFANKETGEPNHAGNAGGASVWFRWSAPASGPVTFSTVGSGFNTLLAAYTGVAVSGLTPIASDDDSGGGGTSTLTFTAVAGQVYYIAVDGSGGAQGSYILSWGNAGSAGTFGFTTGNFLMSERDGGAPTSLTVSQTYTGGRITITRYSGMAGKVRVFYRVSDGTARRAPGDWTLTGGGVESATSMTNSAVFFDGQTAASFFIVPTLRTNNDNIPTTVNLAITGIQFEPGESSAVIPGSIDPVAGTSVARILDGQQGVSLQRLRWRTIETIGTAVVRVLRGNLPFSDGLGTIVTVDMLNNGTPNAPGPASSATLDASSDHAQSNLDFTPSVTTITWVAGQTSADISIPILDDALVEFDEDLAITLRPEPGNGAPQSDTTDGTLTIEFPNNTAANVVTNKHPAGSVDPGWNRDYFLGSNPPDNSAPGANGRVFAVAVQSDLKTVIGGEFTSVNTSPRNRIARMNSDGSLDANFNVGTGANGAVNGLAVSTNGQVIIGGAFSSYSGTLRGGVARLSTNAVLDPSFNPGAGATGGPVRAVALYTNGVNEGKVIVVGDFTSFAGVNARRLVRLNADGSVDPLFSAGLGPNGTGPNGAVNAVLLQSNGKLVIGGDFTSINSVSRNRVARLNADGTLDATFNPGAGADNSVFALGLDRSGVSLTVDRTASGGPEEDRFTIDTGATSGTITINYEFYLIPDSIHVYYGGALIFDTGVTNGAGTINVPYGPGASTTVDIVVNEGGSPDPGTQWDYSATITPNGGVQRYLVGGAFTTMDFQSRNRLARLNPDGSLDTTYDPGFGADDTIYSIAPATNGPAYIGGLFASYNGTRRIGLARVATDGTLDTGFMDAAYNQFAGIPTGFSPFGQPKNSVRALAVHRDGGVMIGGSFHQVGGGGRNQVASGPNSPWGPNVSTPVEITRDDLRNRYNIARIIGGTTAGPGNIGFTTSDYTADENGGARFITVARSNGSLGGAGALFATGDRPAGPGAASSTTDYVPFAGTLNWPRDVVIPASSAYTGVNNTTGTGQDDVSVTILPDNLVEGEERLNLTLDLPQSTFFSLGGQFIPTGVALGRSRATLTIEDDTPEPTYVTFATNSFIVDEGAGVATISVLRSGNTGNSVTLNFLTLDGSALNNSDYTSVFGPLTFSSGETNRTFNVPITDDTFAELDETIILQLTNLVGAVFLPGGNAAILTIHDNDFANGQLRFSQTNFNAVENSGLAQVVVQRTGGNVGAITAQVVTSNLTALAGADYTGVTNTLSWANGDTSQRVINIPLLPDGLVEGPEFFTANIINAQVVANGNPVSVAVPTATVTILDSDAYGSLHFAAANFTVSENGGKAIITVTRTGGSSGTVSVNYNTADGTAFGGVNYTPVIGTLTLGPGVTSTNFTVPVTDDFVQNANRTVFLNLNTFVNATPAAPTAAILTIVDDESVNEPAGSVDTTYNAAAGANDFIYSLALQPDGQLVIGGDFTVFNNFGRRRLARLDANGNLDPVFLPPGGANDSVRSITVQPDGRLIVGGFFTNVAATTRNHLSRLNTDGTTDSSFDPGAGADGPVFATALHGDPANAGRIIVGGNFAAFNGNPHPFLARLLTNGVVDESFNPGVGPDGTVYAAAVQPDGKVLIAGDFRNVAGQPAQGLARLNPNGALDAAFVGNLGTGFTGSVRALALQSDGRILVGGLFTNFNGAVVGRLVRLQANGTVDAGFAPNNSFAAGGDGSVLGLALQPDGKLIVVGDFSKFSSVTRNRITRLKEDGTVDPTINFGLGANNFVAAGVVQITDGRIIVAGGFTAFDGLARNHLARLYGGVLDGPGRMEFSSATYVVAEAGTNATITVRRTGGTTGDVTVTAFTSDGTATAGLDYGAYSNTLAFVTGEVVQTFVVGITNDSLVEGDEFLNLTLATNALSGVTLGNQPVATLTIIDDDSFVAFSAAAYSVNEGVNSGVVPITVVRTGGTNGTFTVQVVTSNLTATAGADYIGLTNTLTFLPGELSKTVTTAPAAASTGPCWPPPAARQSVGVPVSGGNHSIGTGFVGVSRSSNWPVRARAITSLPTGSVH
ncbi:MAG: hypothetical protein HY301_19105, partial [Verrucomicrobia bacterium]|nr:hypothetical protein [Verrucomicrobiota bacterium]